ncbi:MAG: ribosomal-protein-alanine N-acetyltransferase [Proteobacteria bacterium]|nr:MAG: ribosomal-protein-alanine N-acetyltransferase [Pseudomonadota bacterium]
MFPEDVPRVMQIETAAYSFPWSDGIFRDCLRVGYVCVVAEIDDIVVGYAIMSTGAGEAHVLNLCIGEPWRHRGLGGQLLAHLLEFAKTLGVVEAFLEVRPSNTSAIRLYQSSGFSQIGVRRGYYQAIGGREDAVVLRKSLGKRR